MSTWTHRPRQLAGLGFFNGEVKAPIRHDRMSGVWGEDSPSPWGTGLGRDCAHSQNFFWIWCLEMASSGVFWHVIINLRHAIARSKRLCLFGGRGRRTRTRVMLHVFPVMLQETRATLHASASAEYTKPSKTCFADVAAPTPNPTASFTVLHGTAILSVGSCRIRMSLCPQNSTHNVSTMPKA